jgi:hypothetical protein
MWGVRNDCAGISIGVSNLKLHMFQAKRPLVCLILASPCTPHGSPECALFLPSLSLESRLDTIKPMEV